MKHPQILIFILMIVLVIIVILNIKSMNKKNNTQNSSQRQMSEIDVMSDEQMANEQGTDTSSGKLKTSSNSDKTTTLSSAVEVKSALIEKIEPHASYYLEEVYVEENSFVAEGENILKYTNGEYLVAPYDCYIVSINLPEMEAKILNSHYVEIESKNMLTVSMKIDEANINKIEVGLEAKIKVSAIDKTYTGYVTHIASIASNGKFEIDIEFENDGDVKLGMTSTAQITI